MTLAILAMLLFPAYPPAAARCLSPQSRSLSPQSKTRDAVPLTPCTFILLRGGLRMATYMSAEERRGCWTSLAIGLTIPAALLLVAVAASSVLLKAHVQFVLVLSLLTAAW